MSQTPATLDRALWWLLRSEWRRSAAASVLALVVATVVVVGTTPPEAGEVFAKRLSLAWLALYLLSYLAVTFVLLRQPWERLARWAETSRDASWVRRYLLLLEPGAGLAVLVAFLALFYSVLLVVERTTDVVLVFGRETGGLPAALHERYRDRFVTMPIDATRVRSLNLSTSVGIAVYEVLRQRRARTG